MDREELEAFINYEIELLDTVKRQHEELIREKESPHKDPESSTSDSEREKGKG